jgi:hypothetical protein
VAAQPHDAQTGTIALLRMRLAFEQIRHDLPALRAHFLT